MSGSSASQSFNSLPKRRFLSKLYRVLEKRVPITKWLPSYSFRDNFCGDLTGGLTTGIMHVSEGMAYAPLTGLKPVNGLFSSLFPAFIYMFFGTSRHVSIGGFAVICLMVGSTISRVTPQILGPSSNTTNSSMIEKLTYETNIEVAAALTLGVGLAQILMGFCQFDVLTSFLSDQVITGFTTGAAVHVMTSQLDKAIGARPPHRDGPGKLFWIYSDLFSALLNGHFHFLTAFLSAFLIVTLFFVKNFVDPRLRAALRLNTPIPYDLIVMLLGTFLSSFFSLADRHGVVIIGEIPTGLPSAHFPQFSLLSYLLLDSFSIALIILVIHISMGKLFAKKHNYELNVEQELYATGITECLCSLFPVFPPSTSLGRSLVGEAAGSKTLLTALFSSSMVLLVVLFLGPLLEPLPTCVLSSIVIVSLQGMFRQIGQLPELWRMNRVDALVFLVTLFGTIFVDIVAGLTIGVLFVLATVIYRTQRNALTKVTRMEQSMDISSPKCCLLSLDRSTLSFRLSSSLIFLNVEHFWRTLKGVLNECQPIGPILDLDTTTRLLVIDCQLTVEIDIMGARAMCEAVHYSEIRGYTVHFCRLNESVLRMLHKLPHFDDTAFCERKL